jgi:hypothetical protein
VIRYYFDIRDDTGITPDEEGLEFDSQQEAEIEAALSLADMIKDSAQSRRDISVEVRTATGRVFQAAIVFHGSMTKQ